MKTKEIAHPSELNALGIFPLLKTRGVGRIRLSAKFAHADRDKLEKELNQYFHACGCSTSAKLLLLGIGLGLVYSLYAMAFGDSGLRETALTLLATGIAGGILGKVAGVLAAHRKLLKTIHTIQAYWIPEKAPRTQDRICGVTG